MHSLAAAPLPFTAPEARARPHFTDVTRSLVAIDSRGPRGLPSDALREDLKWFAAQQRALEAMSAAWLAELDRREPPSLRENLRAPARWLHSELNVTPRLAHAQIRTARALDGRLRLTAGALRRGEISAQHVAVIRRASEQVDKTSLDPASVESALVCAAKRMDPVELKRHWEQMCRQADQDGTEEEQRTPAWLSLRQTWWGSYRIEGRLDADHGATLATALQMIMGRKGKDDHRTQMQRRAAALGELARFRLDAGDSPHRGGGKPQLAVMADLAKLRLNPDSEMTEQDSGNVLAGANRSAVRRARTADARRRRDGAVHGSPRADDASTGVAGTSPGRSR